VESITAIGLESALQWTMNQLFGICVSCDFGVIQIFPNNSFILRCEAKCVSIIYLSLYLLTNRMVKQMRACLSFTTSYNSQPINLDVIKMSQSLNSIGVNLIFFCLLSYYSIV
jgi:hypothetical protein